MAANSLLAGAVQMLCVIAWRGDEGANAEVLAKSLNTNPVVVRRILKALEGQGLVALRPGCSSPCCSSRGSVRGPKRASSR